MITASAIIIALLGEVALAAPAVRSSIGGVPISDYVIPFSGKVPRAPYKTQALHSLTGYHPNGYGQGSNVSFDAPYGGSQYTVNITVAGGTYNLIFDTGSSDLWLAASNFSCLSAYDPMVLANYTEEPQAYCMFGADLFDANDLSQLTPVNFTNNFNISYGVQGYSDLQFAVGSSYTGAVSIGNLSVPNAQLNIVESAEFFGNNVSDGLIGFAGPGLTSVFAGSNPMNDSSANFEPYLPWFYQAAKDNLVAPFFSIALNRPTFTEQEGTDTIPDLGTLTLGGIPNVPLTGKHVTVDNLIAFKSVVNGKNVSEPLWWTTSVSEWTFPGSTKVNTTTQYIILDSGTFNVYAPNAVAAAYANAFSPAGVFNATIGGYVVPCNATVPALSVTIGGVQFPFDKQDLIFPADASGETCLSTVTQGGNSTQDIYILGDKFLNSVVAGFDVQKNQISIYERQSY